jgi:hypothetical protein
MLQGTVQEVQNGLHCSATDSLEQQRDVCDFVETHGAAMLYHQPEWLKLIGRMTGATPHQVVVKDADGTVRAWASVHVKDGPFGLIANSSPYFGSHGGILADGEGEFDAAAQTLSDYLAANGVACANIIEPLFEPRSSRYRERLPVTMGDERHGQVRSLVDCEDRAWLLADIGGLTRSNLKRKAWRAGIEVKREETDEALAWLYQHHRSEMTSRPGGNPKSVEFFAAVADLFRPGSGWRLYTGWLGGRRVAGLLVICWREFVEYITPVFDPAAREHQPLSAVIFEAMHACAQEGFRWWNFGGTWPSQASLKAFKDSWGCDARVYRYHVLDYGGLAALMRPEIRPQLAAHYPGFYVYPFGAANPCGGARQTS